MRSDVFYRKLKEARRGIYDKVGGNPSAYAGKKLATGGSYDIGVTRHTMSESDGTVLLSRMKNGNFPTEILLALNSFLLRSEHPHEQEMLNAISKMQPQRFDFNPGFYRYGGSYIYTLAGLYFILSKLNYLHLSSDTAYYLARPDEMARFYVAGRLLSVFCGGIMVLFTYAIAKKLYDEKIALLSGILTLLLPVLFVDSCTMRPQIYAAAWAMCGMWFSLNIDEVNKNFYLPLILTSLCLGMAIGAALNSWIYLIFPTTIFVIRAVEEGKSFNRILKSRDFIFLHLLVFMLASIIYLITNPYVIFNVKNFMDEVRWMSTFRQTNWLPLNFFTVNLREILGVPLLLTIIGAVFYSLIKSEELGDKILLSYLLPAVFYVAIYFGGAVETGAANVRYHLPLVLLILVWCAAYLIKSATLSDSRFIRQLFTFVILLVAVSVGTERVIYFLRFYKSASNDSINLKAGRWINENIPRGASIGILKYTPHTDSTPPFRFTDYTIVGDYEHALCEEVNLSSVRRPEYFLIMENPDYEILKKNTLLDRFLSENYNVVRKFEFLPAIFRNYLGYGEQTVKIYILKKGVKNA